MSLDKNEISDWFKSLQDDICQSLEIADGSAKFQTDNWNREEGGGGRSRIIQNGSVIEKGGVNFSAVYGELPENIKKALKVDGNQFFATGVSIVIHPINPFVPIIHMNVRYFEIINPDDENRGAKKTCWFGGGIDLTPHYVFENDAQFFHKSLKNACDKFDAAYYQEFKKWADDYFYINHRNETRGIGGIFFDRLTENEKFSIENRFEFVKEVGLTFAPVYTKYMDLHKNDSFSDENKQWQMLRRGRYVEFNLVYDKGTKFGLDTNGRIESILMSLPPLASWLYDFKPKSDSKEQHTLNLLKKDITWVS